MTVLVTPTVTTAIDQAKALTVSSLSARQLAADLWDCLRAFRKKAEAQKEDVCRPLKTAWDEAKVPFDSFIKECQGHEATLQKKMGDWDREQERLARVEQAKIQAQIDAKNAKIIEKAEAKGLEPVLKIAPIVQAPPKSIETQAGTTQSRTKKYVYKPTNLTTLMRDFPQLFVLDMSKFNALAKTGLLDGRADIEISEEFIYSQRA